ncbi:MAG: hypothetical protein OEW08_02975 [Gammaproteobacteria bacterium]|nr:hypothetical protein [Gammaproteobacteria bacterium]
MTERPHDNAATNLESALLDDACRTVLPMLSGQIELAKRKTEEEIIRLTKVFLALKGDIDSIGENSRKDILEARAHAVSHVENYLDVDMKKVMDELPTSMAKILRNTDDILFYGDKVCAHGADLYQAAIEEGVAPRFTSIAMKTVVTSFEILEFGKDVQSEIQTIAKVIPDLINTLLTTIELQGRTIASLQKGQGRASPNVTGFDKDAITKMHKNIDVIIEGLQFQDQVCQTLDSVTRSMQDFIASVPELPPETNGGKVDLAALIRSIKSHSVTHEQHALLGTGQGGLRPGDATFL